MFTLRPCMYPGCDSFPLNAYPHIRLYYCACTLTHMHSHSLVPRPSASRARIAYVTFEPLSDSWQKAWYHSYVIYIKWTRFGTRFHVKWRRARSSRANGRFPSELLITRRQQLDANSALTGIQHALTFNYSGVPSAWYSTTEVSYCTYLGYYNRTTRSSIPDSSSGPPR